MSGSVGCGSSVNSQAAGDVAGGVQNGAGMWRYASSMPGVKLIDISGVHNMGHTTWQTELATWATAGGKADYIAVMDHGIDGEQWFGTDTNTGISDVLLPGDSNMAAIQNSIKPGGGLVLLGCNVAASNVGVRYVNDLAMSMRESRISVTASSTPNLGATGGFRSPGKQHTYQYLGSSTHEYAVLNY
jgi:hypothetical protein